MDMDIATMSAAMPQAQVQVEASMAVLDKTLDTAQANAAALLEVLPAANPAEGNNLDRYA